MCLRKKYQTFEIDECIKQEIEDLNKEFKTKYRGKFKTILSCCGHNKYHKTVLVRNVYTGAVFEWFSKVKFWHLCKNRKYRSKFYVKDSKEFYFIPEVENHYKGVIMLPMEMKTI